MWLLTEGRLSRFSDAKMEDLGTGEYAGGFSAMTAGAYSVSVTFQGTHIAGSPFAAEASRSHKIYQHQSKLGHRSCPYHCQQCRLLHLLQTPVAVAGASSWSRHHLADRAARAISNKLPATIPQVKVQ
jgi:Filamin/ABP280 repeat